MLAEKSVRDLLAAFASSNPTPGGGSASACAAAMGAALLVMVATLPKTRSGSEEDRPALSAAGAALADILQRLTDAIDADAAAYDQVVAAYKQRKTNESEQAIRQAAIQRALRGATDAPLGVMRLASSALTHATSIAAHAYPAAASDAGVAVMLLSAGLEGSRLNVESNLGGLADETYVARVRTECQRLTEEGAAAAREAGRLLRLRVA